MSAKTAGYSVTHHRLGPGDLWHTPGLQLPAYIQNIAAALERDGHSRSSAISTAVGTCRRWAAGGGKVTPEVRAAAAKALAEWEAAKARAHATSHTPETVVSAPLALALFDPAKHPRAPKGASNGGKFAAGPARDAAGAQAQKDTGAQSNAAATVDAADADAKLKALSDNDLQALSKYAYSFKSADPKVVALRIKIANQLSKRGMDVNNYGGQGKATGSAPKPATKKPATGKPATKKTAGKKAKAPAALSHRLALATPMVTSGDGAAVTVNGALKSPTDVQAAVRAHAKVPPPLRPAYRRKVIGQAKKLGALRHIPPAWLNGKET